MNTKTTKQRTADQAAQPSFVRQNSMLLAVGAGILLSLLAYGQITGGSGGSASSVREFVIKGISGPLEAFRESTGSYPATTQGLKALVAAPTGAGQWSGPYIAEGKVPTDPWGSPYQYAYPGHHNGARTYDVWSKGPDKRTGTADDIGNW